MNNSSESKIWFLHALRGVAALLVVVYHYGVQFWHAHQALADSFTYLSPEVDTSHLFYLGMVEFFARYGFNFGTFGVAIFFLISGFVIPLTLQKTRGAPFLISRFFRIYPTYIIGFTITFLLIYFYSLSRGVVFSYGIGSYLAQILLIRDWLWLPSIDGISWTLETEIKFYLLIWGIWSLGRLNSSKTIVLTALGLCATNILLYNQYDFFLQNNVRLYQIVYVITFSTVNLIFMFLGICFYNYHTGFWSFKEFLSALQITFLSFIAAVLTGPDRTDIVLFIVSYTAAFLVFVNIYLLRDSIQYNSILNFFADISYPLYIVHGVNGFIVMTVLDNSYHWNPYLGMAAAFIVATSLAYVLHVFVEDPTNRFGKKIARSAVWDARELKSA